MVGTVSVCNLHRLCAITGTFGRVKLQQKQIGRQDETNALNLEKREKKNKGTERLEIYLRKISDSYTNIFK